MPRATSVLAAALGAVLAVGLVGCSSDGDSASTDVSPSDSTDVRAASDFLSSYVTDDGRVLRHDQGDDVVSEGQAYGMLIAELAGRPDVVRSIWSWTRDHLARDDGLLAYHASADGTVLDDQAAADADALAAFALLRYAGDRAPDLHADGRALASAVLAHETVRDASGGLVLVAGPWAVGPPTVVNPSYWMPSVFDDLEQLTGDERWSTLASTSVDLLDRVTEGGGRLPPDWAILRGGSVEPAGPGGGGDPAQYGPDAQRVPLWLAASCDDRAATLQAAWWKTLQQEDHSSRLSLSLDGSPIDGSASAVALLAAAAAARASGDAAGAQDLERGARQTEQGTSTYFGGAWLALAEGLSDGRLTGGCTGG